MRTVTVDGQTLTIEDVVAVAYGEARAALDPAAIERMSASRAVVDAHVAERRVEYGITTGLGELKNVHIGQADVRRLQRNLLLSHAAGTGDPMPPEVVRAMLLLRANALARGVSGVRPLLVQRLLDLLDHRVVPVVPSQGSVGSSGDLVPLAHAALVLIGEGEAFVDADRVPGAAALRLVGLEPLELAAKEGLALVNGTQFQTALAALVVHEGERLLKTAQVVAAMTLEALMGSIKAFDPDLIGARPHPGAVHVAANVTRLLADSPIVDSHAHCERVQDAYSLRCIPQVHGAAGDALAALRRVVEVEVNAATDNPLVFPDGRVVSGGNFHGEPIGQFAVLAASALAKLAVMSERRISRALDPATNEGLPAFLTPDGGVNSGLMIPQYVAASIVSENSAHVTPLPAMSVPTSANQEDVNGMGAVMCRHAWQIMENLAKVVGIEAIVAAQALDLREPLAPAPATKAIHDALRTKVARLTEDRWLAPDIEAARGLVRDGTLLDAAQGVVGRLGP